MFTLVSVKTGSNYGKSLTPNYCLLLIPSLMDDIFSVAL